MSKAYKCDKCEGLFEECKENRDYKIFYDTFSVSIFYNKYEYYNSTKASDICITCEIEIMEEILKNLKKELPKGN